jgi:hypothetical protein
MGDSLSMKKFLSILIFTLTICFTAFASGVKDEPKRPANQPVNVGKHVEVEDGVLTWVSTDTEVDNYNFTVERTTQNFDESNFFAQLFNIEEYEENTVYTFSFTSPEKNMTISFVLDGDTYHIAMDAGTKQAYEEAEEAKTKIIQYYERYKCLKYSSR